MLFFSFACVCMKACPCAVEDVDKEASMLVHVLPSYARMVSVIVFDFCVFVIFCSFSYYVLGYFAKVCITSGYGCYANIRMHCDNTKQLGQHESLVLGS